MAAIIIVLDVFVGIIAVLGLIAGGNQLRARLHKPGAKGVVLAIDRLTPRRKNIARLQVSLRMVGPAVRYEVALDTEADGNRLEVSTPKPETRPSMGCDDDELSWSFEIPEDDLDGVWVIASWIDDHNAHLRMAALASNLGTLEVYEWKWAADWRLSAAGHWRKRRTATIPPRTIPGMGPLELGRAPGRKRLAQIAAEAVPDATD
ncbi:MAG: hypothetical protein ABR885_10260 [Mycobacterium sp.]